MPLLAFLHTSPAHVPTFDRLAADLAPDIPVSHYVAEALLAEARRTGPTAALRERVRAAVREIVAGGASAVLCTCSTIGGIAEDAGAAIGAPGVRVDRAMADRAVALGGRIVVVAALESTIGPTTDLLRDAARRGGRDAEILVAPCPWCWPAFERGDEASYRSQVAAHVRDIARPGDVVVLAQASMAPASDDLVGLGVPILSSPRLGLAAALAAIGVAARSHDP